MLCFDMSDAHSDRPNYLLLIHDESAEKLAIYSGRSTLIALNLVTMLQEVLLRGPF